MHESTRRVLLDYACQRERIVRRPATAAFFLSERGTRVTEWATRYNFAKVSREVGLRSPVKGCRHGHGPRLHDMRHRFAVRTLVDWYRAGIDVEREIPKLATYLGHVHVNETYWYLEAVPELLELATRRLERMFEARGETMPEGLVVGYGIPISVLILILVAVTLTVVARKTRFGRYIFATGGNPDAAELSGINTRMMTVKIFALMGFLCALSAVVASARLANHSNDIGTLDELRVIAAAVIGGTALSGGIGTIYGAILGALIMQALQSGMAMVGVDAPFQNIVVGTVLVLAVYIDIVYRKRLGAK